MAPLFVPNVKGKHLNFHVFHSSRNKWWQTTSECFRITKAIVPNVISTMYRIYRFPKYTDISFSTVHRKRFFAKVKPLYRKIFVEVFDWLFKKLPMILIKSMTSTRWYKSHLKSMPKVNEHKRKKRLIFGLVLMQGETARLNQVQWESNNTSGLFWVAEVPSLSFWSKRVVILQMLLSL
jgi:hypothetical protein